MIKRETEGKNILRYLDNDKKNIIFGAGSIASLLKDSLDNLDIEIDCFIVNDGHKKKCKYKGIEVYEIAEIENEKLRDANILYSIQSDSMDILNEIKKINENIIFIGGMECIFSLLNIYYKEYLEKEGIDITRDIIKFNGISMINPFLLDKDCLNAFLFEMGDLILPNILGDYSKINEGPYEYDNVKLCEDDVVIDCGANIGIFSAIAAHKKCKCYSFEPVKETLKYLDKMSDIYDDLIKVCEYALSDQIGKTKLYLTEDTNISNSILGINQNKINYIEVNTNTIDNFIKIHNIEKVDFIKADIEGAERLMLKGAVETLKNFGPKLSICTYHLEDDKEVLESIIKNANPKYKVIHKWKKLYAYIEEI